MDTVLYSPPIHVKTKKELGEYILQACAYAQHFMLADDEENMIQCAARAVMAWSEWENWDES